LKEGHETAPVSSWISAFAGMTEEVQEEFLLPRDWGCPPIVLLFPPRMGDRGG
jgi:hypothetical protein